MTDRPPDDANGDSQSQLLEKIDQLCDRFEAAWRGGTPPRIEDWLEGVEEPLRSRLLEELVALDLAYRQQRGETPDPSAYVNRFPADSISMRKVFANENGPISVLSTADPLFGVDPSGKMKICCPDCQTPVYVPADTSLTDLTCENCSGHFSLVHQGETTRTSTPLSELGRFELLERLGVGGFGSVWKARDKELDRTVAIKIPRRGSMTPDEQERFIQEARAVAQLRHPNIVSVHDVGRNGELMYIVSDFIRGVNLDDLLTSRQLTCREAAELCAKMADALHHAHEAGVVHRDLKPGNILIDGDLEPHIVDFGLARRDVDQVTLTLEGQILGTPAYMSPEQARGEAHQADCRSDIYSLGVILFQLLTGERPFRGSAQMLVYRILNDAPPSPRKLNARVSQDLEMISLKCLEKEPSRRYQTAQQVADELRRYLAGEPIQARPIGKLDRLLRWGKKRPALAALGPLFLALVGLAFLYRQHTEHSSVQDYLSHVQLAYAAWQENDEDRARDMLARCIPAPGEADQRDFAWHYLWGQCQRSQQHRSQAEQTFLHEGQVSALAISGDGTRLASGGGGILRVWNTKTGTLVWEKTDLGEQIGTLALTSDGSLLVSGGSALRIWNLADGSEAEFLSAGRAIQSVALSHDETLLASGHRAGVVKLWDLRRRELLKSLTGHTMAVRSVVFSPDNRTLVSGDVFDSIRLWDIASGTQVAALVGRYATFTPDGHMLATAGKTHLVQLWNVSNNFVPKALPAIKLQNLVRYLGFVNDCLLLLAYESGQWEILDVSRGEPVGGLRGTPGTVDAVALSAQPNWLATAVSDDGQSNLTENQGKSPPGMSTIQFWQVEQQNSPEPPAVTTDWLMSVVLDRDGKFLTMATGRCTPPFALDNGVICRVTVDTGEQELLPDARVDEAKTYHWLCLAHSPDESWLACGGYSSDERGGTKGIVVLWPLKQDDPQPIILRHSDWVRSIAFTHDGALIAVGGRLGPTVLWDIQDAHRPQQLAELKIPSWSLEFSPDDQVLAAGGGEWGHGTIAIVNVNAWKVLASGDIPGGLVTSIVFLPDGKGIAVADYGGNISFYNLTLQKQDVISSRNVAIRSLALAGRSVLVSAGEDGVVKLWHIPTRTMLGSLPNDVAIYSLSFADEAGSLVAGKADGTVEVWRTQGEDRVFVSKVSGAGGQ